MTGLRFILILTVGFFSVFFETWFNGFRAVFGAQVDLLPSLLLYVGLTTTLPAVAVTAVCTGLWYDSFSVNPLGVSVLPLLGIGLMAHRGRELLWNDHPGAQFVLGAAVSAAQPLAVLFLLYNLGAPPILGWKSVWQWIVMTVGGGLFAPVCFGLFRRFHRAFDYQPAHQMAFRPDREIKRGRG